MVADEAITPGIPTLRIKHEHDRAFAVVELNGRQVPTTRVQLDTSAGELSKAVLDILVLDGLDVELPAAVAINLLIVEPGTLDEVDVRGPGLAAITVEPTPSPNCARRWTFRRVVKPASALAVVDAVLKDLRGRSGFDYDIDIADENDMRGELADLVAATLRGE